MTPFFYVQIPGCFILAIALVLAYRRLAVSVGLVDRPGEHKTHKGHVPLVGGLAIFSAFFITVLMLKDIAYDLRALLLAIFVLLVTGVVDDLKGLRARSKFPAQILAALVISVYGGMTIYSLGDLFGTGTIVLDGFALSFTLICIVAMINAMNMMDGLDGLAGGISFTALSCFAIGYAALENAERLGIVLLLMAAVAGFLVFNLRAPWRDKALVFLGDAGSMPLGLVLTWLAIDITQAPSGLSPVTVVWILGLPLLDVISLTIRRASKGRSPFSPDQTHLHHLLLRMGLSKEQTVLVMVFLAASLGGIGLAGWLHGWPEKAFSWGFAGLLAVYFTATSWYLGRKSGPA